MLPVVEFTLPDNAGKIIVRDNFYDTKISFELKRPLPKDTFGTIGYFDPADIISDCYCEGFPSGRVHGSFKQNQQKFTVETRTLGSRDPLALIYRVAKCVEKLALEQKPAPKSQARPK